MKKHSYFSPSGIEKWFNCPASIAMENFFSSEKKSFYLQEGTIAHKLAEILLKNRLYKKNIIYSFHPSKEMLLYVKSYVNKVWEYSVGNNLLIEYKVDYSSLVGIPNQFGTADAIILSSDKIQIHDLKYGFYKVSAKNNKQLQLYALGALNTLNVKVREIEVYIHQPRLNHFEKWITTFENLLQFEKLVKKSTQKAFFAIQYAKKYGIQRLSSTLFNPGIQCKWCGVSGGVCRSEVQYYLKSIKNILGFQKDYLLNKKLGKKNILNNNFYNNSLSLNEFSILYSQLILVDRFIKSIKNRIKFNLKKGNKILGMELKNKIGKRVWKDEKSVDKLLKSFKIPKKDRYVQKLITPLQAEKTLQKKHPKIWNKLNSLIIQVINKYTF